MVDFFLCSRNEKAKNRYFFNEMSLGFSKKLKKSPSKPTTKTKNRRFGLHLIKSNQGESHQILK